MHGVRTFLGWGTREAASAEAGKLLPGTWEASPAGRVGAYRIRPPSATIGGEYMFHIRPLRVRLRGRMRYAPTAGYRPYGYQANFAGARRRPRPYSQASADAQSPRGLKKQEQRPDYIVIDDLDDDEMSHNEERVRQATDWVKQALFGALDVGRGRFLMVGNGFAKHMVLKNIADIPSVKVSKVYAVDSNGSPVWADKWTKAEAEAYADFVGYASWQREMMHNPVAEGGIFKWQWIRYKKILPLRKYDQIICYIDPSFKSTTANDYKAARVWGKTGRELHLIDCYVRQDTVAGMVRWLYDFHESLPEDVAVSYFMEANFMQDIILDEFAREGDLRGYQLPIMPDRRKKPDKLQRIEAVSPLWERGLVYYNEAKRNDTDMKTGIDQTLSLARGSRAHDDAPDADEGAIYKLQKASREERFEPIFGERPAPKGAW